MMGAIAGDVIGAPFEIDNTSRKDFALFGPGPGPTDDTILTCAVAEAVLDGEPYVDAFLRWFRRHPTAGYGSMFVDWAEGTDHRPYGSFGNGSAMRVSPVAWAFSTLDAVRIEATRSAVVTHDHPDGVKGACAVAEATFLARTGATKDAIAAHIEGYGYALAPIATWRRRYTWNVTCAGSVPQALRCFLEATSFEDTLRTAISIGGDSDTIAAMAGSVAEAFYGGVPGEIAAGVRARLTPEMIAVVDRFRGRYGCP